MRFNCKLLVTRAMTAWVGIIIMCPSGVTYLPADSCFSVRVEWHIFLQTVVSVSEWSDISSCRQLSEWSDISSCRQLFQWVSTMKIQLSVGLVQSGHHFRGCDHMVVGFTTACALSSYHHKSCEFKHCSCRGVLNTTLCDKVCKWLTAGRWFSPGNPVSSTNKTDGTI